MHAQTVVGIDMGGRVPGRQADARQEVARHRRGDVVLVVEVQVEGAEAHIGSLGDGTDRRPFHADLGVHAGGRLHQAAPGLSLASLTPRQGRGGHARAAMRFLAAASTLTS